MGAGSAALLLARLLLLGIAAAAPAPPPGFPPPPVPRGNPITPEKVALGRRLFYDKRLSGNSGQSCASCHEQARAFTDGRARALGSTGRLHPRSAMSLANAAFSRSLTWTDPGKRSLEEQALGPLLNEHPVEMGARGREKEILGRIRDEPVYRDLFPRAFPGGADPFTLANVRRAIASFERTILSGRSAYDRFVWEDDRSALSNSARRGMVLFFSDRLACAKCHAGFTFSGSKPLFANNGLPGGKRFRIPTLRNVSATAPYMHDGRFATLDAVVEHYALGGTPGRNRSPLVSGFSLTPEEKCDLIGFLESLTDEELLGNPELSDPWRAESRAESQLGRGVGVFSSGPGVLAAGRGRNRMSKSGFQVVPPS
jgi:cytochrome c peroxidase